MLFFKHLFGKAGFGFGACLLAGFVSLSATVAPAVAADTGKAPYIILADPQNTDSGKKVEVVEFFWYNCGHCFALDPSMTEWVKRQGNGIVFKRVPVAFRENFLPMQKMYYALEAMGKIEDMHAKIFHAIHVGKQHIDQEPAIFEFMAKNGIDKQKFADTYNSFSVQTKAKRATQLQGLYKIDGVPYVVIDGRYGTSPTMVNASLGENKPEPVLFAELDKVMDGLVAKAKKH